MDFWRNATKPAPFVISGVCVEKVNKIKFQRRCIPENLTRTSNIIILVKKAEQWLSLLRILRKNNLQKSCWWPFITALLRMRWCTTSLFSRPAVKQWTRKPYAKWTLPHADNFKCHYFSLFNALGLFHVCFTHVYTRCVQKVPTIFPAKTNAAWAKILGLEVMLPFLRICDHFHTGRPHWFPAIMPRVHMSSVYRLDFCFCYAQRSDTFWIHLIYVSFCFCASVLGDCCPI